MIELAIVLIILVLLFGVITDVCLCKESINWRNTNCGYDLEEGMEEQKRKKENNQL